MKQIFTAMQGLCVLLWLGCAPAGGVTPKTVDLGSGPDLGASTDLASDMAPSMSWVLGYQSPEWFGIGVHGSAANDVWAVGENGRAAHFDGTSWTEQQPPGGYRLFAVWDASPKDVWVVGMNFYDPACAGAKFVCGILWHWDGTAFTVVLKQPERLFHGIWGSSAKDIWIVGSSTDSAMPSAGLAWHFDGSTLTEMTLAAGTAGYSVSGTASDDVWMVASVSGGGPGAVFHYDGTSLRNVAVPVPINGDLYTVQARSRSDVWIGGDQLYHFDGTNWRAYALPSSQNVYALWASSPTDVWTVGVAQKRNYEFPASSKTAGATMQHFDGTTFSALPLPYASSYVATASFGMWGFASDDIWAVGEAFYHYR